MKKLFILFLLSGAAMQTDAMFELFNIDSITKKKNYESIPVQSSCTLDKKKQEEINEKELFILERIEHRIKYWTPIYGDMINDQRIQDYIRRTAEADWVRRNWESEDQNRKG